MGPSVLAAAALLARHESLTVQTRDLGLRRLVDSRAPDTVLPSLRAALAAARRRSSGSSWQALIGAVHAALEADDRRPSTEQAALPTRPIWLVYAFTLVISVAFSFHFRLVHPTAECQASPRNSDAAGLLAPSDSLKTASASIAHDLPHDRQESARPRPAAGHVLSRPIGRRRDRPAGQPERLAEARRRRNLGLARHGDHPAR